jgi:hypothetical protein
VPLLKARNSLAQCFHTVLNKSLFVATGYSAFMYDLSDLVMQPLLLIQLNAVFAVALVQSSMLAA